VVQPRDRIRTTVPIVPLQEEVILKAIPTAILVFALLAGPGPRAGAADALQFVDGDRVVLVGNTLIEREQRSGYWETRLTSRYPGRNILFRNLGWSGDTVFGEAQAGFGSAADGFRHCIEHVTALKPTVILLGYGLNESFAGEAGLPRFRQGMETLLDALRPTKARIVVLSPLRHEDLGRPLPDPTEHNRNLRLYRDALREIAEKRKHAFVDLYELLADGAKTTPPAPLTDNGIHLTDYGYWRSAAALERGLGLAPVRWHITIDAQSKPTAVQGADLKPDPATPLRFAVTDAQLPIPLAPPEAPAAAVLPGRERTLRVTALAPGKYALRIDGKEVAVAGAAEWAAGVRLQRGPEFDQVERLRAVIIEKNRLYFHRWRPQNETYLFGFRKREQGQNAREIPEFDPLVAKLEAEIADLRVPQTHQYELVQVRKRGQDP
jgi:lysophospholipase L1-like esterase